MIGGIKVSVGVIYHLDSVTDPLCYEVRTESHIKASAALDIELVPETERVLTVTPDTYLLIKKSKDIVMNTEIGEDTNSDERE